MKALKSFGYGLLYFILFPFIAVFAALIAVFAIVNLFIQGIKGIINFFSGREVFPDFEEDKEAKRRIEAVANMDTTPKQEEKPASNSVYVQNNYYQQQPPSQGQVTPPPQSVSPIYDQPQPTQQVPYGSQSPSLQYQNPQNPQVGYQAQQNPQVPYQSQQNPQVGYQNPATLVIDSTPAASEPESKQPDYIQIAHTEDDDHE